MQANINVLRNEFGLNPAQHLENHVIFYLYEVNELRDAMSQSDVVQEGIVNVANLQKYLKTREMIASSEIEELLSIEDFNIGRGAR